MTFSVYVSGQADPPALSHPLCGTQGVADKNIFTQDPASCHNYLFCQWNPDNLTQLIAVHQLDCRNQNSNHYEPDATDPQTGMCVEERPGCADTFMFFCQQTDIMVNFRLHFLKFKLFRH